MRPISAGDLEKYGYCPLSWWLSLNDDVELPVMVRGIERHQTVSHGLRDIQRQEERARGWETVLVLSAVIATLLSVVGIGLVSLNVDILGPGLAILSVPWIIIGGLLFIRSRDLDGGMSLRYERGVLLASIGATLLAASSLLAPGIPREYALAYQVVALAWLDIACLALAMIMVRDRRASKTRDELNVKGNIDYVGDDEEVVLRSEYYGLSGRPDYIVSIEGDIVPVEVKTGRTPKGPLFSHLLQVGAYCLLLEEQLGRPVPYGILRYNEMDCEIEFDKELRGILLAKLDEMRTLMISGDVHRNHGRPGKCRNCSRRERCPERLV